MSAEVGQNPKAFDLREFFFRHRDHIPVPVGIAGLVGMWFFHPDAAAGRAWLAASFTAAAGLFIFLGEVIRVWSVGHSGATTRSKDLKAAALATGGPYAMVRNPIYVGNFLLGLGFVMLTRVIWVVAAYVIFFAIQYSLIVSIEEEFLEGKFGDEYRAYKSRVRRFIPSLRRLGSSGTAGEEFHWRSLRGEKWTLLNMLACGIGIVLVMGWIRHGSFPLLP